MFLGDNRRRERDCRAGGTPRSTSRAVGFASQTLCSGCYGFALLFGAVTACQPRFASHPSKQKNRRQAVFWRRERDSNIQLEVDEHDIDVDVCPSGCHPCPFQLHSGLLEDKQFLRVMEGWDSLSDPLRETILALIESVSASRKAVEE